MKISIIIPVFNEVRGIRPFWHSLRQIPQLPLPDLKEVEFIVVDDGSTDGTTLALRELEKDGIPVSNSVKVNVRYFRLPFNRGKGAAVRTGIDTATGEYIFILDADREYSTADFPVMLKTITEQDADIVIGTRVRGYPKRVIYFWNAFSNQCLVFFINLLAGVNLTDVTSGLKAMRREFAQGLRLTSNRFAIDAEIVIRSAALKARIFEVPISFFGRTYAEGKKVRWFQGLQILLHSIRCTVWDRRALKPGLYFERMELERKSNPREKKALVKTLKHLFPKKQSATQILEIGSGLGNYTIELTRWGKVVAADPSERRIAELPRQIGRGGDVSVFAWDGVKTYRGPSAGKIDLIVAMHALEAIEDVPSALAEWASTMVEGAHLIITVTVFSIYRREKIDLHNRHRCFSRNEIKKLAESVGLELIERPPVHYFAQLNFGSIVVLRKAKKAVSTADVSQQTA